MITAILTCHTGQGASHTSSLSSYLTPELTEIVRADTEAWIKGLRAVSYDGRSMRERFTYRQDSLWWFTELYLHKARRLEAAVSTVLALESACEQHAPSAIVVETDDLVVRDAAHIFGRTRSLPVETGGKPIERQRHARPNYLAGLTATLSQSRPLAPVFLPAATSVAAFVQTSFRRTAIDPHGRRLPSFVPQVFDALADRIGADKIRCVGVGPRRNLRRNGGASIGTATARLPVTLIEQLAPHGQLGGAIGLWRRRGDLAQQLTTGEPIRASGRVRRYDLWPVLQRELEAVALRQWPWSARAMDEATAALGAIKPEVVLTYAEAGAWGRALILESRRRHVPSVAVPCELAARTGFAFSHEPDELMERGSDLGFPVPDRVLVFDQLAAEHLDEIAHIPSSRIVITGHPRSDGLRATRPTKMTAEEREHFRSDLGVARDQRLAVLIARFGDLGALLPAIITAAAARPRVHLAIKAHPADAPEIYQALSATAPNISVVPDAIELARLLAGADGLITRESTVAIDALAIGVPSLVVGSPDHLGPLVDAGIMLGATTPDAIGPSIDALLYDDQVRKRLRRVVGVHSAQDERARAGAAERTADAILELRPNT